MLLKKVRLKRTDLIKINFLIILLNIVILASCKAEKSSQTADEIISITLVTDDKIKIHGTFYKSSSDKGVILLHMLDRNRNDYQDFAKILQKDFNVFAIDFRGHGESDLNYREFLEQDFNGMIYDAEAAKKFLNDQGIYNLAVIGASIGANIAVKLGEKDNSINQIVLLSPGLDYRGIKTEESIKNVKSKILIVASEEDNYSFDSSKKLYDLASSSADKEIKILKNAGHGTNMLFKDNLFSYIQEWLNK